MTNTETPKKDHWHDKGYKRRFSFPKMVEDLLTDFVKPEFLTQLDFSTLEKVNASYVTDDYRDRSDDLVWKVQWRDETVLYIYILLEFQSTVDTFMAVRIMAYLALLYQDLIKTKQLTKEKQLPPVLPMVLYRGQDQKWNAKEDIQDLIAPWPKSLEKYRPTLRYFLIEETQYSEAQLTPLLLRNAVAALFQMENDRRPEILMAVVKTLSQCLTAPTQRELNEELTRWIRLFILATQLPDVQLQTFTDLQELETMLSTQMGNWTTLWKTQGLAQGRAEGRAEGQAEGQAEGRAEGLSEGLVKGQLDILRRLLEEKFGPLATDIQSTLSQLEEHAVLDCVKRTFTAKSVQEVIRP